MNIYITNVVVEVDPSAKKFKENLYRREGVLTIGAPFLICLLNVSLQLWLLKGNHRTPPSQLRWITIISIFIRMLRPSKDHQIVIEQQPDPSPNATKASENFLTPGDDDMVQHISPINKPGS